VTLQFFPGGDELLDGLFGIVGFVTKDRPNKAFLFDSMLLGRCLVGKVNVCGCDYTFAGNISLFVNGLADRMPEWIENKQCGYDADENKSYPEPLITRQGSKRFPEDFENPFPPSSHRRHQILNSLTHRIFPGKTPKNMKDEVSIVNKNHNRPNQHISSFRVFLQTLSLSYCDFKFAYSYGDTFDQRPQGFAVNS
jgi:hypothetical protein